MRVAFFVAFPCIPLSVACGRILILRHVKLCFVFQSIPSLVLDCRGKEGSQEDDGLEFGRFDLGFAVDILEYVYEQELQRRCACFLRYSSFRVLRRHLLPALQYAYVVQHELLVDTTAACQYVDSCLPFRFWKGPRHCALLPRARA